MGNVLKHGVKNRGVRRATGALSHVILLSYLTTNCGVHFGIDTFTHNDHDGYVQFSMNLTQKRLWYQNGSLIFINLRPPVVHSPYSPRYDSSNIPMFKIYSWKMVIYDRKIAAIILYIESTLGSIYSKYAMFLWISLAFDYIRWLAMLYIRDFWCQTCNTFIKMVRHLYKMVLITQTTLICVVKFKETTVICNRKQI